MERWVAVFDTHGDAIDPDAEGVFWDFMRDFKPTIRIHGGDAMDLRPLRGGASSEEKHESIRDDVKAGTDFLKRLDASVWLLGNHDHRLIRNATQSPDGAMRDLSATMWQAITDSLKCHILPWGKRNYYQFGDHRIVHGYRTSMYAARQVASDYNSNAMMGHVHASSCFRPPCVDGLSGHTSGCLRKLDADFNNGNAGTLSHNHGWLYGVKRRNSVTVFHAIRDAEGWVFASDFTVSMIGRKGYRGKDDE